MLGTVLSAEEASVRTLWSQVTEMQLGVPKAIWKVELGEASGAAGSGSLQVPPDLGPLHL